MGQLGLGSLTREHARGEKNVPTRERLICLSAQPLWTTRASVLQARALESKKQKQKLEMCARVVAGRNRKPLGAFLVAWCACARPTQRRDGLKPRRFSVKDGPPLIMLFKRLAVTTFDSRFGRLFLLLPGTREHGRVAAS